MMDGNRIMHRVRPRPYDLRRKVLLKNFLREQLTYIPPARRLVNTSLDMNNDLDFSQEESPSIGNEENIEASDDQPENVQTDTSQSEPVQSSSTDVTEETVQNSVPIDIGNTTSKNENNRQLKFRKFSSLKLKFISRKKRKRGISKGKLKILKKKKVQDAAFRNPTLTSHITGGTKSETKNHVGSKKFWTLFKSLREKKHLITFRKIDKQPSDQVNKISSTSNQSVQTDISLLSEKFNDLKETNKCLQEENRKLSESLSYLMSDVNFKLNPKRKSFEYSDSFNSASTSDSNVCTSQEESALIELKDATCEPSGKILSRTKLLQSKSVQENGNCHKIYFHKKSDLPETSNFKTTSKLSRSFSLNSSRIPSTSSEVSNATSSEPKTSSVLKNLPTNTRRAVNRSLSMPERISDRPSLRPRLNNVRSCTSNVSKKPNDELSYSNRSQLAKYRTRSDKPIIRRASMPERVPHKMYRTNHHKSVRILHISNMSNKTYIKHTTAGGNNQSVGCQNLPNEAFY